MSRPTMIVRIVLWLCGGIAAVYGAVVAWFMVNERRIVFRTGESARSTHATDTCDELAHEEITITTEDGMTLSAWVVMADAAAPWLLFLHGNAGRVAHHCPRYLVWKRMGLNVLAIDYRGYGTSLGMPSEQGVYRDATAALRYLTATRGVPLERIVVHGFSLGGAVAVELARRMAPAALIVESSFTSVADIGMQRYPFLPIQLVARNRFNALAAIAQVECPTLFICSADDTEVPCSHSLRLHAAATGRKSLLWVRGEHDDTPFVDAGTFYRGIATFLSQHTHVSVTPPQSSDFANEP